MEKHVGSVQSGLQTLLFMPCCVAKPDIISSEIVVAQTGRKYAMNITLYEIGYEILENKP